MQGFLTIFPCKNRMTVLQTSKDGEMNKSFEINHLTKMRHAETE